jgi:hypothetical protein
MGATSIFIFISLFYFFSGPNDRGVPQEGGRGEIGPIDRCSFFFNLQEQHPRARARARSIRAIITFPCSLFFLMLCRARGAPRAPRSANFRFGPAAHLDQLDLARARLPASQHFSGSYLLLFL